MCLFQIDGTNVAFPEGSVVQKCNGGRFGEIRDFWKRDGKKEISSFPASDYIYGM